MLLYIKIAKFNFLRFFVYPIELIANFLKRIVGTFFIITLWVVISNSGGTVDLKHLIPYYFIAAGVAEITMSYYGLFGKNLGRLIKHGNISNVLIKPVNPLLYIFFQSVGESGTRIVLGSVMVLIGIILDNEMTAGRLILFFAFLIIAVITAFAFNVFEGTIYFYVPEAGGFRSSINHLKNILGGLMVPLYVFPMGIRNIIELLPFATLVYYPAHAQSLSLEDSIKFILIGIFWCVSLNLIAVKLWNRSLNKYEAIGI